MLSRRLLIVDEQPIFLQGLADALRPLQLMRIVGAAGTAHQALQIAVQSRPHLAIVSESLPGISGPTLIASLAELHFPCLSLAMLPEIDPESVSRAHRAGAAGVISRGVDPDQLRIAVSRAFDHRRPSESLPLTKSAGVIPLSTREMEILDCVAQGYTNREIAEALFVTEQTVKNHMTSVFRKLDVEDRVQALLAAVRRGWVTFGSPAYDSSNRKSA